MRQFGAVAGVLSLLLSACGGTGEPATTLEGEGATSTSSGTVSTTARPATTATTTTAEETAGSWTVDRYGQNPVVVLDVAGALGSGCSPGTDLLPDGIWFGWIDDVGTDSIEFDLACLWPGRLEPAASNEAAKIRTLPVEPNTLVYAGTAEGLGFAGWSGALQPAANAPGLPESLPFWLFVNDGIVTEMAEYPVPVRWALSASAWPKDLLPGCCATGDVAPPSPAAPLPNTGWPVDGFYGAYAADLDAWASPSGDGFGIEVFKYVSCGDRPDLCLPDWSGSEVSSDPDAATIAREVPFDTESTVVLMPIFSDSALVGDGDAFRFLIEDVGASIAPIGDPVESWDEFIAAVRAHGNDPDYPLGIAESPDSTEDWPIGYRGPGGTYLTVDPPWMSLEIRSGRPILYIHAGQVAG